MFFSISSKEREASMKIHAVFILIVFYLYFISSGIYQEKEESGGKYIVSTTGGDELESIQTVTDIDGNVYRTLKIGGQIWMAENLRVTHYRDGTPIPYVQAEDQWSQLTKGAYCLDQNDPAAYKETYGALYNFYTVSDTRSLSPEGWHVPTAEEWGELIEFLGGEDRAGGTMKDVGSNLWKIPTHAASNESGFSALPAGGRGRLGDVGEIGYYATWWSSTADDPLYAWHWGLYPDKNSIRYNPGHKASGFSVRCIKDQ